MTADVVHLADWRRSHARGRAVRARHPSIPLVAVGAGRTAHAVDVPRTLAYLAHGGHVTATGAYVVALTLCGRDAYGDTLPRDAPLCRACERKLTGTT